jgi:hypothetical protein
MALPETYYTIATEDGSIPPQYEWYTDINNAKTDVVDMAEDDAADTYVVYELTVRALYCTRVSVELEKV